MAPGLTTFSHSRGCTAAPKSGKRSGRTCEIIRYPTKPISSSMYPQPKPRSHVGIPATLAAGTAGSTAAPVSLGKRWTGVIVGRRLVAGGGAARPEESRQRRQRHEQRRRLDLPAPSGAGLGQGMTGPAAAAEASMRRTCPRASATRRRPHWSRPPLPAAAIDARTARRRRRRSAQTPARPGRRLEGVESGRRARPAVSSGRCRPSWKAPRLASKLQLGLVMRARHQGLDRSAGRSRRTRRSLPRASPWAARRASRGPRCGRWRCTRRAASFHLPGP